MHCSRQALIKNKAANKIHDQRVSSLILTPTHTLCLILIPILTLFVSLFLSSRHHAADPKLRPWCATCSKEREPYRKQEKYQALTFILFILPTLNLHPSNIKNSLAFHSSSGSPPFHFSFSRLASAPQIHSR